MHLLTHGHTFLKTGSPGGSSGKESACQCRRCKRCGFDPWVGKIPCRKKWQPTPVVLSGKLHGYRTLAGYSPCGYKESDITGWLNTLIWNLGSRHWLRLAIWVSARGSDQDRTLCLWGIIETTRSRYSKGYFSLLFRSWKANISKN